MQVTEQQVCREVCAMTDRRGLGYRCCLELARARDACLPKLPLWALWVGKNWLAA